VGFANGRLMNEDINISLHTMALARGARIGAIMYYVKCHYAFEILGNNEFWATYESYNGWHRWGWAWLNRPTRGRTCSTNWAGHACTTSPGGTGTRW
jgi:hypothetical protein